MKELIKKLLDDEDLEEIAGGAVTQRILQYQNATVRF